MKTSVPDNHFLHIQLTKIEGKIDAILMGQSDVKIWQGSHEKNDNIAFTALHKRIGTLRTFGASIAIVATSIGFAAPLLMKLI